MCFQASVRLRYLVAIPRKCLVESKKPGNDKQKKNNNMQQQVEHEKITKQAGQKHRTPQTQ